MVTHSLRHCGLAPTILEFSPYSYDERQYCSPGFNSPVGLFQRSQFGQIPQYHTSADNLDFIAPDHLADQCGNPTSALDLASAILQLSRRLITEDRRAAAGIYHFAGRGETTWHGLAEAIFDLLAHRGIQVPRLEAIATEQHATAARRPRNSRVDSSKAEHILGIRLPAWACSVETCLEQLVDGEFNADGNCTAWQRNAALSDHYSGHRTAGLR
ncbi:DUF4910 domain-containing protein [Bradyrhizobium sp. CCBAU 11386]|uniref:DUF4910 domain-containing protein n=1 Tax=Bradyrhizobium sp. CCBAU 11386 TaxID=1630837 RepID=UPI003FA46D08